MPFDTLQANLDILKKRYAEASRRTIFFVGAGGSAEVGVRTWGALARNLHRRVDESTPTSALSGQLLDTFNDAEELLSRDAFWDYFAIIEKNWNTLYNDYLEEEFSAQKLEALAIPALYKKIWRMRNVGQVMTLNLDGLLARAYEAVRLPDAGLLQEFPGTSITDSRSFIDRNYPVLLNLHGSYKQRSTWVMSSTERDRLFDGFSRGDYKSFVKHIFQTYNIVFIGVNIRDKAISPIIESVSTSGLLQDHFWITPSIDSKSYAWAQQAGVRVINYDPDRSADGETVHSSVICGILDEVENHRSDDRPVILPHRTSISEENFPEPVEIISLISSQSRKVRQLLDGRIEFIGRDSGFDSRRMAAFIKEYSIPIEISSVLGAAKPYDEIEDYSITSSISESNSSTVWMAKRHDETLAVIKSLSGQAFKDKVERESFRRGIESLYQLNSLNNPVAPRYLGHTNTPLALAMEFIEGASLAEFMTNQRDAVRDKWLSLFKNICTAVRACHLSEGEVLHRDVKPKNVIFQGVYIGYEPSDVEGAMVRLINFDMSWHKFSAGNSKSVSADEIGYYAPEQRNFENSDSPRTAKTDVYMLGMTLLSMLSDASPPEGGSRLKDWREYVERKVRARLNRDPLVEQRVARLIINMTRMDPEERPDLHEVVGELELIDHAINEMWLEADADLFIEKLLVDSGFDYLWDDKKLIGRINTPRQIELSLSYIPRGQRVELRWMRQRDDGSDRRNFGGKLGELSDQVRQQLTDWGWQIETGGGHHSKSLIANIRVRDLSADWKSSSVRFKTTAQRLMSDIR